MGRITKKNYPNAKAGRIVAKLSMDRHICEDKYDSQKTIF